MSYDDDDADDIETMKDRHTRSYNTELMLLRLFEELAVACIWGLHFSHQQNLVGVGVCVWCVCVVCVCVWWWGDDKGPVTAAAAAGLGPAPN